MKKCIFCDRRANSKEHIWGRWARELYAQNPENIAKSQHLITTGPNHSQKVSRGKFGVQQIPMFATIKAVCSSCNNGWMSRIENRMKLVFEKVFVSPHSGCLLSKQDCEAVTQWLFLKFCLHQCSYPYSVEQGWGTESRLEEALNCARKAIWEEFATNLTIPPATRISVARCRFDERCPTSYNYVREVHAGIVGEDIFPISQGNEGQTKVFYKDQSQPLEEYTCYLSLGHMQAIITNDPANSDEFIEKSGRQIGGSIYRIGPDVPGLWMHPNRGISSYNFERIALRSWASKGNTPRYNHRITHPSSAH